MAKNRGTRSATYDKKKSRGTEAWTIRASDGASKTVKTSRASAASIVQLSTSGSDTEWHRQWQ